MRGRTSGWAFSTEFAVAATGSSAAKSSSPARPTRPLSPARTVVGFSTIHAIWTWRLRNESLDLSSWDFELGCCRFRKGGESLRAQARGGKSELQKARCRVNSPPRAQARGIAEVQAGGNVRRLFTDNG